MPLHLSCFRIRWQIVRYFQTFNKTWKLSEKYHNIRIISQPHYFFMLSLFCSIPIGFFWGNNCCNIFKTKISRCGTFRRCWEYYFFLDIYLCAFDKVFRTCDNFNYLSHQLCHEISLTPHQPANSTKKTARFFLSVWFTSFCRMTTSIKRRHNQMNCAVLASGMEKEWHTAIISLISIIWFEIVNKSDRMLRKCILDNWQLFFLHQKQLSKKPPCQLWNSLSNKAKFLWYEFFNFYDDSFEDGKNFDDCQKVPEICKCLQSNHAHSKHSYLNVWNDEFSDFFLMFSRCFTFPSITKLFLFAHFNCIVILHKFFGIQRETPFKK